MPIISRRAQQNVIDEQQKRWAKELEEAEASAQEAGDAFDAGIDALEEVLRRTTRGVKNVDIDITYIEFE